MNKVCLYFALFVSAVSHARTCPKKLEGAVLDQIKGITPQNRNAVLISIGGDNWEVFVPFRSITQSSLSLGETANDHTHCFYNHYDDTDRYHMDPERVFLRIPR